MITKKRRPKMPHLGAALLVASLFSISSAAFAGQPTAPDGITSLLAGTAVSDRDLGREAARGLATDLYGSVQGNTNLAGGGGQILNTNSINNNSGITTIFQNTGNNSLFQSQTVINVSIH